eukprot:TRINITY_DN101_c0_g1_i1.p1 TRINITY_DN101_c0_g1~~TRINITY_DN101_c0_g1_i1.p1  ORF type:complete len:522 (-),score=70.68 TRINITY_DN101_c0_g1_i1:55-1590(-)
MSLPALGISIGSAYSCVAVAQGSRVDIVSNSLGSRTTPSYVCFADSERTVGEAAKGKVLRHPAVTFHSVIRLIGRKFAEVAGQRFSFRVVEGPDGEAALELPPRADAEDAEPTIISPTEVLAALLEDLKSTADDFAGTPIQDAVIAVPLAFTDHQCEYIKAAARKAGITVLRLVRDPIAVAMAYQLDVPRKVLEYALVFDCGATQTSATVICLSPDGLLEVVGSASEAVGGDEFDRNLMNHFQAEFQRKTRLDISDNKKSRARLCAACENAKRILSSSPNANCEVDSLYEGADFASTITRVRFEQANSAVFARLVELVDSALGQAKITRDAVAHVLLAGGGCRIPKLQNTVIDLFPAVSAANVAALQAISKTSGPDETIAAGAALQANLQKQGPPPAWHIHPEVQISVIPTALGIILPSGFIPIIPAGTSIPCERQQQFGVAESQAVYLQVGHRADGSGVVETIGEVALEGIKGPAVQGTFTIDEKGSIKVELRDVAEPSNHHCCVIEPSE